MSARRWLIVALLAFLAWQWFGQRASLSAPAATPAVTVDASAHDKTPGADAPTNGSAADASTGGNDDLPPEARATLRLIASNGPFPYDRDGVVFGNFEHRLPEQPRGYYHEYTVPTPGAHNRGARRIIAGGEPPREFYYSDDHYQSFREIEATP